MTHPETADTADRGDAAEREANEQSLQTIDGIGPAYEERLHDAGISSVSRLAATDPAALADRLDIGGSRVASWIEQAQQLTR